MKFSQNGLYIESYNKCTNCGSLIYDNSEKDKQQEVVQDGKHFCSQWCVDWKTQRDLRRATPVKSVA